MANEEHLAILKQGINVWNEWREENCFIAPDLSNANLIGANLKSAHLHNMNLSGARLNRADLSRALLNHTDLSNADLSEADLSNAGLFEATLQGARLNKANLRQAYLCRANLNGALLFETDLREADLKEVDLCGAVLQEANLSKADLSEASLFDAHLWVADLEQANLYRALLNDANLFGADLSRTNLSQANLLRANLKQAYLNGADLREANLSSATLVKASLKNAILTGACLYGIGRDDWILDGINCDFVYWEDKPFFGKDGDEQKERWEQEHRTPSKRDFRPGEFEKSYQEAPHKYEARLSHVLQRIGNLKGELFELVIDKLLHQVFPSINIERGKVLRCGKKKTEEKYEYDYIVTNFPHREIIIIEAKGLYQQKQIPLGDGNTKETVKWFFGRTFPFAKKNLPNPENYAVKACYITWANFTEDAEKFLEEQNATRLKPLDLDVFYDNCKLRALLKSKGLYQEIKVLQQHLSR